MRRLISQPVKATTALLLSCAIALLLPLGGCTRSPQQKYAKFLERGNAQLQKHEYNRAVLEFKNALVINPKSAEAQYQLALAYLGGNDARRAAASLWRSLELDPKYTRAELKLSQMAVESRDPAELREAEKHLRHVLAISPADPDALSTLAVTQWKLGKHEEAEKILTQACADFPQNLKLSINLAKLKLVQKDPSGAEAILKSVADNSTLADAAVTLGQFYVATGRLQDAEQQFQRALQIDPKHGLALVSAAEIHERAGQTNQADQLYKQAASSSDSQYKAVHALFLFRSGKRDLAITEFEKLAKQDPSDRDARSRLIAAYQAVNRAPDAEKLVSAALKKNRKDVDALLQRSQIYVRDGKYAQAQADLTSILQFEPTSAEAHHLLAQVYRKTGAALRSRQELTEALRLKPSLLAARIELSELLITTKSAQTALEILNETPDPQKNTVPVLLQRNWAYLGLGSWAKARKGIDQVQQMGDNPEALVQDGTLKLTQRNFAAARESFERALKKNPDDFKTLALLVQSYDLQKQLPAAVERVRHHAAQRPNSAPVQFFYGQMMRRMDNRKESRKAFAAAKAADPSLTAADVSLAGLDASEDKWADARRRLSDVVLNSPADISAHLALGAVEDHDHNYPAAIEQYRKVVDLDGSNIEALHKLAYLLAENTNHYDEALKFAQKAEELAPDNASVQDTLGWILYRKGLYSQAIPYLERSAATQPTALRKGHLAVAYWKSGNQSKAQDALRAALKIDPALADSEFLREMPSMNSGNK
jgi:tetratricopeptide (TPR) repeat protein